MMNKRYNCGYTLLFAVLTAALVLGVAVFILDISKKQYELSVAARDSMYSFYAADSGIECVAIYGNGPFSRSADIYATSSKIGSPTTSINCGQSANVGVGYATWTNTSTDNNWFTPDYSASDFLKSSGDNAWVSNIFYLTFPGATPTCADIQILVYYDTNGYKHSYAFSRGYNHCTAAGQPNTANPDVVERAIELGHSNSAN
ncbi:MAG: hypothetical protein KGI49_02940 [Patescibacteria group bacterium]|nr:hypothetical protein [Patescibacteria group bacterium]